MFVACADEGNNERRKETMQDAGENQKPETDKYYIRPKAANDRMKLAQNMGQTVYISGATGFGKTSFVADYLFRRRYEYYSMAESVPEDILRGLSYEKKRIVVVDDLQQLTEAGKGSGSLAGSGGAMPCSSMAEAGLYTTCLCDDRGKGIGIVGEGREGLSEDVGSGTDGQSRKKVKNA